MGLKKVDTALDTIYTVEQLDAEIARLKKELKKYRYARKKIIERNRIAKRRAEEKAKEGKDEAHE